MSLTKALRTSAVLSAALVVTLTVGSCGASSDSATTSGSPDAGSAAAEKNISLILGTISDDFYKAVECGAKLEAEVKGVNLDVQGPAQFDAALQIPIVNAVAAKSPQAIIIAPNDSGALMPPLKAAVDGGAKLVLFDTNLDDTSLAAGHIGSDYVLYGQQGAAKLAEIIGDEGSVLGIFSPPGVSTNDLGRKGFQDELAKHPGIKLLPFEFSSGAPGKSAAIVSAVLASKPDLKGIFTFNGGDAQGVVTALREAKAADQVSFVSGDAQPFQVDQLQQGLVKALVIQQARTMGKTAVDFAIRAIDGEQVPAETALPTLVGTLDNLTEPDVADNLYKGC